MEEFAFLWLIKALQGSFAMFMQSRLTDEHFRSFLGETDNGSIETKMIKSFEGIRGLAALIVALYHLNIGKEYFSLLRHGYVFVDLFFVLSGFVICASYHRRIDSQKQFESFMIRRFGRLFPLLVFSTVFFIVAENAIVLLKRLALSQGWGASLSNPGAIDYHIPSVLEIFTTLTFTHSLGVFDKLILNTPTWSISTEFYTYLLFAVACLLFKGKSRIAVFAACVAAALFVTSWASITIYDCLEIGACNTQTFDFGFPRCVLSFFLGALTFHFGKTIKEKAHRWQLAALLLSAAYFWQIDSMPVLSFLPPYLFAFLILCLWADKGATAFMLNSRFCQTLGQRSYSIYLMHMPLVMMFEPVAKRAGGTISSTAIVMIYIAVLIVVSGWTFKLIEDPFRLIFNRLAGTSMREALIEIERIIGLQKKSVAIDVQALTMKPAFIEETASQEEIAANEKGTIN